MLEIFDGFRGTGFLSTAIRMVLAVVCGGIIGIEREFKRRPAGFRTHILICCWTGGITPICPAWAPRSLQAWASSVRVPSLSPATSG